MVLTFFFLLPTLRAAALWAGMLMVQMMERFEPAEGWCWPPEDNQGQQEVRAAPCGHPSPRHGDRALISSCPPLTVEQNPSLPAGDALGLSAVWAFHQRARRNSHVGEKEEGRKTAFSCPGMCLAGMKQRGSQVCWDNITVQVLLQIFTFYITKRMQRIRASFCFSKQRNGMNRYIHQVAKA